MSITSPHQKPMNALLTDVLLRYPRLATWLEEMLRSGTKPQAEALLPSFLLECANQGVPGDAYPFISKDQGLADLRAFLDNRSQKSVTNVEEETLSSIEPFPASQLQRNVDVYRSLALTLEEGDEPEEIEATPLARSASAEPEEIDETPVIKRINEERHQIDETPVARRFAGAARLFRKPRVRPLDLSEGITAYIPTFNRPTPSDEAAIQRREDIVEHVTEPIPGVPAGEEDADTVEVAGHHTDDDPEEGERHNVWSKGQETPRPAGRGTFARLRHPRTRRERLVALVLLLIVLGSVLVPAGLLVSFGISAYATYRDVNDRAHSAVNHLLVAKTLLSGDATHHPGFLDPARLQQAGHEFMASEQDFQQAQNLLQHSSALHTLVTYLPQYQAPLKSAQTASALGQDIAKIGEIVTARAAQIVPAFRGPLLSASQEPLVTGPMLNTVGVTLDQVLPLLNDMQARAQGFSLDALPLSDHEKAQAGTALQALPQVVSALSQARELLGTAGWLLGVGHPRTFLVQTMDRAELRATGGFTGQYGALTINGGRIGPFNLRDISLVEYTSGNKTSGQSAPTQYRSWWPFANWGLRDSNLSADFPTSARIALQLYQRELGEQADGVISFTPVVIEHILTILGPISVPGYNVTVSAQNLENVLHYYQLDNGGINQQINQQPDDQATSTRKRFTNTLSSLLMSKVRAAPSNQLVAIAQQVFSDLKTKELQIYFTDPGAEGLLKHYGYAGQMDRSTTHDGLYVVQANLSASKASQYVQTVMHDTVTLDSRGGATHALQLRLVYKQDGPVYGYDTYYDYVRIYVPPSSRLLGGNGFQSSKPVCGGSYEACPVNGPYPNGTLTCSAGQYEPGTQPPTLSGSDGATREPLYALSGPTNTTSDEPGRAMYGGWIVVPKNCTMNVTLSWYVPPQGPGPYNLLVQRQAGTFPVFDLTLLPNAAVCADPNTARLHVADTLVRDSSFTLIRLPAPKKGCSLKEGT